MKHVNEHTSWVHAVIIFTLTLIMFLKNKTTYNETNLQEENVVIIISVCYFLHDTMYGVIYQFIDSSMLLHHLLTFASLSFVLLVNKYSSEMMHALWVAEISNPFL
jgi:TLC domain